MNFLRAILASLLSLICTLAVSTYVTLQTLESTALDRTEVKGWLDKSGVYNNLLSTILSNNPAAQGQLNTGSSLVSADNLKSGLNQTFTPAYVKQATEKAIDGTYNWLDGNASTIDFSIDTTAKKNDFIANLSSILQPQLATLPTCTSITQFNANNPTCLPPGTTAKQAADELATDAANQPEILRQPLTSQTAAQASSNSPSNTSLTNSQGAQQARSIVSNLKMWLLWLPLIAVLSGGLMVLLSQHKLKAAKHLAGRLTIGLAVTCAAGLLIANVGRTYSFRDLTGANNAIMSNVIEPILHQAAPAIGFRLALVSGLIGLATLIAWIILLVVKRKQERAELLSMPKEPASPTTPSKTAEPTAPQSQPGPTSPPKDEQK